MTLRHNPQTHAIVTAALNLREALAGEQSRFGAGSPGRFTRAHRNHVGELRQEWPDLWTAIDRLVAATKDPD
jgi:hypothetical protein